MRIITALALGCATLALSSQANAQSCAALTSAVKDASYTLEEDALNRISDQLNTLMTQADEAGDGPTCSCAVKQMNDLIVQNGGEADSDYPGSCSGSGTTGRPGGQSSSGPIASNDSDTSDDNNADSDKPQVWRAPKVRYGDLSEAELKELYYRLGAEVKESTQLASEYVEEIKAARVTLGEVEALYPDGKVPASLIATQKALEELSDVVIETRDVIINDEDDVLFVQLEEAIARAQAARIAFARSLSQWLSIKEINDEEQERLEASIVTVDGEDQLAPLNPVTEPMKKAKAKMRAAERRMLEAEGTLKVIRNEYNYHVSGLFEHPFLDMKPGYKEALKAVEKRHKAEHDAACGGEDMKGADADRCMADFRKSEERAEEVKAVFNAHVVPLPYPVKLPSYSPK